VHLVPLAEDGARAEKADTGDHLRRDARRICGGAEDLETKSREQAGPDADQTERLDACGVAVELSLQADRN
jgi:hypothetical protein